MADFALHHGDEIDLMVGAHRVVSRIHHRDSQQDAALTAPHLVAVADGMGGHADGAAAALAALGALQSVASGPGGPGDLVAGIEAAQAAVVALADDPDGWRNPGSTLVAVLADPDGTHIHGAWIGDSRIYGVDPDGNVDWLTEDHAYPEGGLSAALGAHGDGFFRVDTFTVRAADLG